MNKSNLGFGQIELIFVVGTIMAVSAGVFGYAAMADESTSEARLAADLAQMARSLHNAYGIVGSYEGATAQQVIAENLIPTSLVRDGELVSSAGVFTISPITVSGRANAGIRLSFNEVPRERCMATVSALADTARSVLVDNIEVSAEGDTNVSDLAAACDHPRPVIALDYYQGNLGHSGVAVAPLWMPPAAPSTPPTVQPNPMAVVAATGSQASPSRPLPEQCYTYPSGSPGTCGTGTQGHYTWQRDESQASCWRAVAHCFNDAGAFS